MSSRGQPTTLVQCIEYDWALCFRCMKCDHRATWGALDLVERFREKLRTPVGVMVEAIADHCGQPPVFWTRQGAGMMNWEPEDRGKSVSDPYAYRDARLRAFLADQGLPLVLADERKAAGAAFCQDPGNPRYR